MILVRDKSNDSISIYDIILGQRIKQTYYFYSEESCKRKFREYRRKYINQNKEFIHNENI